MESRSKPQTRMSPTPGHVWVSVNPYERGVQAIIVGTTASHVLVRCRNRVNRIRIETFLQSWRWVKSGVLPAAHAIITVDRGGNPYGVEKDQRWRSHGSAHSATVKVIEVNEDDGVAIVQSEETGRRTRVRLDRFRPGATGYSLLNRKARK